MFADPVEIAELLATTQDLIDHNPWNVELVRRAWIRTPGGGVRQGTPVTMDSQRIYLGARTIDAAYTVTWEGNQVIADYVLVGMPDFDVEELDEFSVLQRKFAVVEIHPDTQYEKRAWAIDRTSSGTN